MTADTGPRWLEALSHLLDRSHLLQPDQLAGAVDDALSRVGIRTRMYLVDDEQRALRAVPGHDGPGPEPIPLEGSVPGRVFSLVQSMPTGDNRGWWVPIGNGTDR